MSTLALALAALTLNADPATPTPAPIPADPPHVRQAVERGLVYLEKNKFGFGCISCHDGAWMIWSHHEAARRGFTVNRKSLDLIQTRAVKSYAGHATFKPTGMDQGHDLSVNTMYLTMAFGAAGTVDAETTALLDRMAAYLVKMQKDDGHWQVNTNGEANGPPVVDRHDSTTMWALLALTSREHGGALKEDVAKSCAKGWKWLKEAPSSDTLQSAMLRVLLTQRLGTAEEQQVALKGLLDRQNADGGWSQVTDRPSDAIGTGQSLLALTSAGLTAKDPAIAKAWTFLLNSQKPDGSWYVLTRQVRDGKPAKSFTAASYMGTAWAAIGLVRSLPPDPNENAARDSRTTLTLKERFLPKTKALDLYGTSVTDGDLKDLGEVADLQTLDLGRTKVTDAGLKELAELKQLQSLDLSYNATVTDAGLKELAGLPQLQSLDLSFTALGTDATLKELADLPQLQKLNLEGTAVTDAGLMELAACKQLKVVQLRGTKVTNQGIEAFRKVMPGVQIVR